MINKRVYLISYNLLLITFIVSLVTYFLLLIFNILTENFVAYYLNLNIFLWVLIILGALVLWSRRKIY